MKSKFIMLVLLVLVLIAPAMAVERQQSGDTQGSGLTISVPEQWTFAQYQNTTLRFYVHNTSNYALLTNITTNCNIYLYRPDGTYILGSPLTFDSPISNYFIWLDGSLYLTHLERQHFYVYCNNTAGESGFVESYFDVTRMGMANPGDNGIIFVTLLLIIITALFIGLSILCLLGFTTPEGIDINKVIYNIIFYVSLFAIQLINTDYFGSGTLDTFVKLYIDIGWITNIMIPIVAWIISYYMKILIKKGEPE